MNIKELIEAAKVRSNENPQDELLTEIVKKLEILCTENHYQKIEADYLRAAKSFRSAEFEVLKAELNLSKTSHERTIAENELLKLQLEKAKTEIGELQRINENYAELEQGCYVTGYKNIKAEAYKEIAESLKSEMFGKYCMHFDFEITNAIIDKIVKEKVEGNV